MKLRLRNNSIRFRLTQGEVSRLSETGSVEEAITFGPLQAGTFTYVVRVTNDAHVRADLNGQTIMVSVPRPLAELWSATEQVSIQAEQRNGDDTLHILIEKDFRCLEPRTGGEDDDTFPNPQQCAEN